ncbi:unnamed protein product [Trichogramma brassicae]|uniref:Uncharacterized protein n=1 Tax=Trichogramma brassicae TaxID=86971 RepID=A0A6H5IUI8_9HYME|nr:unnamed protein product [Trichogramma brassicae]
MAKIISTLPAKYNAFISAWDSVPEADQSLDRLRERLLREETQMTSDDDVTRAFATTTISPRSNEHHHQANGKEKSEKRNSSSVKSDLGRVSDGDDGVEHLERATTDENFQADGKGPVSNERLARLARCSARAGEASLRSVKAVIIVILGECRSAHAVYDPDLTQLLNHLRDSNYIIDILKTQMNKMIRTCLKSNVRFHQHKIPKFSY